MTESFPQASEERFLSAVRPELWGRVESRFPHALGLARRMNRLALRAADRNVTFRREADYLAAPLFVRAIQNFEASLVLAVMGMRAESRSMARGVLETATHCLAACLDLQYEKGGSYIARLTGDHDKYRTRVMKELDEFGGLEPVQRALWEQRLPEIRESLEGIQRSDLPKLMADVGMGELYTVLYRPLSQDAHPTASSAGLHVRLEGDGEVKGLRLGPDHEAFEDTVAAAVCSLWFATQAYLERFGLEDFREELSECYQEYQVLSERVHDGIALEAGRLPPAGEGGTSG